MIFDALWFTLLLVISCFVLVRNNTVHSRRMESIWNGTYELLPSYEAMLFRHRYWHLWSAKQWTAWVSARRKDITV
jgi:hypothetical protein